MAGPDEPAPKRSVPVVPLWHWEGATDPEYLLREIKELQRLAQGGGLGTLAYLLECAAIECRHQVELRRESQAEGDPPA